MMAVGIFSRESADCYRWLIDHLHTFLPVENVQTVIINNRSSLFTDGISCAILYHTKNRGRINVTDVTDSLYGENLEVLSRKLGRNKVIVVIDDLEDCSDQMKAKILVNQPSIRRLARDLFLFSPADKEHSKLSQIEKIITELTLTSFFRPRPHLREYRRDEIYSFDRWKRAFGIMIGLTVLCLYAFALWWYNYRVWVW
ncbi:uncharacterized protein LOC142098578 isoform X2 [Mixophyes fleayi]